MLLFFSKLYDLASEGSVWRALTKYHYGEVRHVYVFEFTWLCDALVEVLWLCDLNPAS